MRPFVIAVLAALPACTTHHHYAAPTQTPGSENSGEASECAPLLPAPDALATDSAGHEEEVPHSHEPVREQSDEPKAEPAVIPHADLKEFGNEGTKLVGLATRSLGARSFEIWRSQVPPGGATPLHVHSSEEIFVVLRGKGEVLVGEKVIPFEAPATVIAPAGIPHQLKNTGDEPTDQIVVVAIESEIKDEEGEVMELPWRK